MNAPTVHGRADAAVNGRVPRRDFRLDWLLLRRIYHIARPYWVRHGAWRSWLVLIFSCGLIVAGVALGGWVTYLSRDMTNALVGKQENPFWTVFALLAAVTFGRDLLNIPTNYLASRLNVHWRNWLTDYITERYLQFRAYYVIGGDPALDNPDQRIQEEVPAFVMTLIGIPGNIIGSIGALSVQSGVLMSLSMPLFWATIGFSVVQFLVTIWLQRPIVKQSYDITLAEADLRYGLLHVRNNAEVVAFYRGEGAELGNLRQRMRIVVEKLLINVRYNNVVAGGQAVLSAVWMVLPLLLLVPMYFAGQLDYGAITQAQMAAVQIQGAFSAITVFIPVLASLAPHAVRLAQLDERCEQLGHQQEDGIRRQAGDRIELDDVSVHTPGGELSLVKGLSLTLEPGARLLIMGQTGVGKSSLLRTMAGLWSAGSGRITMPSPERALFLPQAPYMTLSDLRSQIMYPAGRATLDDAELQALLERVQLGDLAERHGGFDTVQDWGRLLSLGEQQRIAFARVLYCKPEFVFLDEATSAVDAATEDLLYALLRRSGATVVSVGHRARLIDSHQQVLRLLSGGAWRLETAQQALAVETQTASPAVAPPPAVLASA
ncbi:ABC transporter ATP-binding protein/permease [Roseateles cellulosilyticus]|uniref:ATP-binding cassette domain-containing protein n=1 Tax=Pelomonas cellulosilytica TaxID=2906762 RepID=A0ABS8Y449_9BURK|nr:ATP-binding cassette domain-containing protein [Pelomonas sp. P8]MCE4557953.1 ATP-binding cassette domain-containing protein [Pelomonas sp. P8]